jgi:hypothetical protein
MLSHITTIKWFDSKRSSWVTDYHNNDEENPLVICMRESETDTGPEYSFCVTKKLADDIHNLLERVIREIHSGEDGPENIKVINLSLNCNNNYVSGKFSIRIKDEI